MQLLATHLRRACNLVNLEARIALSAVSSEHFRQFVCPHLHSRVGIPHDLAEVPRPVGIPLASRPSREQAHQLDQSFVNSWIVAIERRFSARSIRTLFHRAF
jgi:hypothetical protein